MSAYEHKLVYREQLDEHFAAGWEPVPHVPKVVSRELATPMEYLVLRRSRGVEPTGHSPRGEAL